MKKKKLDPSPLSKFMKDGYARELADHRWSQATPEQRVTGTSAAAQANRRIWKEMSEAEYKAACLERSIRRQMGSLKQEFPDASPAELREMVMMGFEISKAAKKRRSRRR